MPKAPLAPGQWRQTVFPGKEKSWGRPWAVCPGGGKGGLRRAASLLSWSWAEGWLLIEFPTAPIQAAALLLLTFQPLQLYPGKCTQPLVLPFDVQIPSLPLQVAFFCSFSPHPPPITLSKGLMVWSKTPVYKYLGSAGLLLLLQIMMQSG